MQLAKRAFSRAVQFSEWHVSHLLLGRPLWLQNRFRQRYEALCFADYKHLRNGNPEVGESLWMERNLRKGDVVLDVGANHGIVSLECSLFVGSTGKVHAFEPAPRTRACLIRHLMINHINNVSVFGVAVSDSVGTAQLRVYENATGMSTLSASQTDHLAGDLIEVPTVTLDLHCEQHGIRTVDLLKLDIEGHELFALRGTSKMLMTKRVRAILFEVGDRTCRHAKVDPQQLFMELQTLNYDIYTIQGSGDVGQRLTRLPPTPFAQNFLAVPIQ